MVFLEHRRIVEPEAVIHSPPAAHRIFLQHPQARGGLARIRQRHARALKHLHQGRGGGGDTGETHGQVEGGALRGHQGRRRALELQEPLAHPHGLPIRHQRAHPHGGVEQPEQRLHQHATTEDPVGLGEPVGPARATSQRSRCEVAAAYVFVQPGPQLALKRRRERQVHGDR